ncbi:hypothetical protein ACMHYB_20915 [Sorangium sp. So ce1128]
MSQPYVVISIERASVEQVRSSLERYLGTWVGESLPLAFGLRLEISENSEYIEYAERFLEEHQLQDDNPIWLELDVRSFSVDVDIYAVSSDMGVALKEIVGDCIAKWLSRALGVRTVFSIENGYVPFGIYQDGKKVRDFAEHYSKCFERRDWIPLASAHWFTRGD